MKNITIHLTLSAMLVSLPVLAQLPKQLPKQVPTQRQSDVAERGTNVMPFNLGATTHFFTKSPTGGTQSVVAKDAADTIQVKFVRAHLLAIKQQFLAGDFSGPSHIHGADMPGLAELRLSKPGEINIAYREVNGGAELTYQASEAQLVAALHQWFDAQLSDHGADAMQGYEHHHMKEPIQKRP